MALVILKLCKGICRNIVNIKNIELNDNYVKTVSMRYLKGEFYN